MNTRLAGIDDVLPCRFGRAERRSKRLQPRFDLPPLRIGVRSGLDLPPISGGDATCDVHRTPMGRWPDVAAEHAAGPVMALPANTIKLADDDGNPGHAAVAYARDQPR